MATVSYPYQQYQGVWTLSQASDAVAQGKWAPLPQPHLFAWGSGGLGMLGLGNTTSYSSPVQVGSTTKWTSVNASSGVFTVALQSNGTLWSWGLNSYGNLGNGNTNNYSSPVQIGALTTWLKISAGSYNVLAIKTDGTLWSWGQNNYGQLGLNNRTNYSSPKQIGLLTTWAQVSTGNNSAAAIKTDGTLWMWGINNAGQLGTNNATYYSSPKQVGSLTTWSYVYTGSGSVTAAIKTDGTLWVWGDNGNGKLGLGNTTPYSSPKQVGVLTNWSSIATSDWSIAVKTDGTLWSWGGNSSGQLGLGNTTNYSSPKQVGSLTNWNFVSAGASQSAGIKTDGTLWTWGQNNGGPGGQLGLGNRTNYSSPKQVGSLTSWTQVSLSYNGELGIAKT